MALTQAEAADKYQAIVAKRKIEKVEAKAEMLRYVEWGSAAGSTALLAGLDAWKPELNKYQIPAIATTALGLGMYVFAGKSEGLKEVGSGFILGGGLPLMRLGVVKGIEYIRAA
jgi:hypothetical protein